ncbi:hypothetical protein [Enhygromyxa salina]|uniref:Uncharacterized protein n=1 Tax=Enhygromyxa salina TaxID=215803 RepID=A0A2S9YU00_9BACT|nr:hypothetical protein [Enhygromyxa salina]PRQ08512.1 hypothetical protein ENSA7_17980 [Enhygromyxa salina]
MTDTRDDFSSFAETAHMFFGIDAPFVMIREELEKMFCQQVPDSRINSITCDGEPKFLTLGRRAEPDAEQVVVTHYGVCFQCTIDIETNEHHEPALRCTMTLAFGDIDKSGEERMQAWMNLHDDADPAFDEEVFKQKFLGFRDRASA